MNSRAANINARMRHCMVLTLLSSRSQAQPPWSYKALQHELAKLGHPVSIATVRDHVLAIRGKGARYERRRPKRTSVGNFANESSPSK